MRNLNHPRKPYWVIAAFAMSVAALLAASPAWASGLCTFSNGAEGWEGDMGVGGVAYVDTTMGNRAPSYRIDYHSWSIYWIELRNSTNADFIGDYTATPQVEISLDTYVTTLQYIAPISRTLIVELRDYDDALEPYGWTSVWAEIGTLDGSDHNWNNWSITIDDTSVEEIPEGWHPYGDEDPETYEYILPEGRTFANVLAGVDEIVFTTCVPGYMYADVYFDVSFDNVCVNQIPEPATALLLIGGFVALIRRR